MNFSAATYFINVKKMNKAEYADLSSVEEKDFLSYLDGYLKTMETAKADAVSQQVFRSRFHKLDKAGRTIHGIFEGGGYGITSEIRDSKTYKIRYNKKKDEAEVWPFFYMFYIPSGKKYGVLLIQRIGASGVYSQLRKSLNTHFREAFQEWRLQIEEITHPDLIKEFTEGGSVKKIKFRKHEVPSDLVNLNGKPFLPSEAYMEISIIAKRNRSLGNIKKILKGDSTSFYSKLDWKPDERLVEVQLNGKTRVLQIGDEDNLRSYYDLAGAVKIGTDGHPTPDSLLKAFSELRDDIWKDLLKRPDPK